MKILHVVGARPNFVKIAPVLRAFHKLAPEVHQVLVHTGQHYDKGMSAVFFDELRIPAPDVHLGVGGGSHAEQTARIMMGVEPVLAKHHPDWVFVVGDVNSTLACSLVASKMGTSIAHIEAGLRSGDMTMPEEVNRRLTDAISSLLFVPSVDGEANLLREGVAEHRICLVGNVMIDTLVEMLPAIDSSGITERLGRRSGDFALVTLHRPSNVDDASTFECVLEGLRRVSEDIHLVFPVHPRTRQCMTRLGFAPDSRRMSLIEPLGYVECLALTKRARFVITDSGGMQEETTFLQVPCLTVRPNTERPITITMGTNRLVASTADCIHRAARELLQNAPSSTRRCPPFWDGKAADRIVACWQKFTAGRLVRDSCE